MSKQINFTRIIWDASNNEHVVMAYDEDGRREECDYYAADKADAEATAVVMLNPPDSKPMLIHRKTGELARVGDIVMSGRAGEAVRISFFREPHKPSSEGKVCVIPVDADITTGGSEYYVSVFDLEWTNRQDRAVCPVCDMWADGPDGDCINHCKDKAYKTEFAK